MRNLETIVKNGDHIAPWTPWAIQWWKPHRCTITFEKPEIKKWRHNLGSRWKLQKMARENFSIGAFYNKTKNQDNPIKTVGWDVFLGVLGLKNLSFLGVTQPPGVAQHLYSTGHNYTQTYNICPSLIEIGSKTAEKNSAQTNKQTDRQTNTTKIMVTWPWTKYGSHIRPNTWNMPQASFKMRTVAFSECVCACVRIFNKM